MTYDTDKPLSEDVTYPNGTDATELTDSEVMDTIYSSVVNPIFRSTESELPHTYLHANDGVTIIVDSATGETKEL